MKKTRIVICQGSSCFARGNKENLEAIQKLLVRNNLMADISFKGQLCTANCQEGPVVFINDELHTGVDVVSVEKLIIEHFNLE